MGGETVSVVHINSTREDGSKDNSIHNNLQLMGGQRGGEQITMQLRGQQWERSTQASRPMSSSPPPPICCSKLTMEIIAKDVAND